MNIIKSYRPEGLEVTLDNGSVIKLMALRENPRFGIIARIEGQGRVVLWNSTEYGSHREDTEEQLIERLKEKLA